MTEVAGPSMFTGDPEIDAYLQSCHDYVYGGFCKGCGKCCSAEVLISTDGFSQIERIAEKLGTDRLADVVKMVGRVPSSGIDSDEKFYERYGNERYYMRAVNGACAFLDKDNRCYIYNFKPDACENAWCRDLHGLHSLLNNRVLTPKEADKIQKRIGKPGLLSEVKRIADRLETVFTDDGVKLGDILAAGAVATIGKPDDVRIIWEIVSRYKNSLVV